MTIFSYAQPYVIIGALIERDGKFLLLQENHAPNAGLWNIPSGKLNFGESPLDAARREVHEESGLSFVPERIVSIASMYRRDLPAPDTEIHALRIIYAGKTTGEVSLEHGEPNEAGEAEIAAVQWVTAAEIRDGSPGRLRYDDIPSAVRKYEAGQFLSLDSVSHFIQGSNS